MLSGVSAGFNPPIDIKADKKTPERESGRAAASKETAGQMPAISLPKGGGAIKGIGEKFEMNPVTGTGVFQCPYPNNALAGVTLLRNLRFLMTPAQATGRLALGGIFPFPLSHVRPTKACQSMKMQTNLMNLSCLVPKTWYQF